MRGNRRDTSLAGIPLDNQPETLTSQSLTVVIEEKRFLLGMA